jgi:hypothetical protein
MELFKLLATDAVKKAQEKWQLELSQGLSSEYVSLLETAVDLNEVMDNNSQFFSLRYG